MTTLIGHNSSNVATDDRTTILSMFFDMAESDQLSDYLQHISFDFAALSDSKQLPDAILGHYRVKKGKYDIDRASHDLLTFPPVASRVFQLLEEKARV